MKVTHVATTPDAEKNIVYIARVSSSRKDKSASPTKLIKYLIKNKHWSPFEHAYMTVEIETSLPIATQFLRHRSFTFQQFSQRYQDVSILGEMFEPIELRQQHKNNRQSSSEVFNPTLGFGEPANLAIELHLERTEKLYKELLEAGVARECARFILPQCTRTKLHMTGAVRNWIHMLDLRCDDHSQKEIRLIAAEIKEIFKKEFPTISKALDF